MEKKYFNFKDLGNEYKNIENFSKGAGSNCSSFSECASYICTGGNCCGNGMDAKFDDYINCTGCNSSGCSSCSSGYELKNHKCVKIESGNNCSSDVECPSFVCRNKCCKDSSNASCSSCDSSGKCSACQDGYDFMENGNCGVRKGGNDDCTGNKDCESLNCAKGKCKSSPGKVCINDNECGSGKCLGNVCCKEKYDNCLSCSRNFDPSKKGKCEICKKGYTILNDGKCGKKKNVGSSCNQKSDCIDTYDCVDKKCSYK